MSLMKPKTSYNRKAVLSAANPQPSNAYDYPTNAWPTERLRAAAQEVIDTATRMHNAFDPSPIWFEELES